MSKVTEKMKTMFENRLKCDSDMILPNQQRKLLGIIMYVHV